MVRLESPELGGLGEGAAAEAADASDEALAGERAIAEQDECGARDLADALALEGERLAGELDGLAALREVALAGRNRGRRRLGWRGGGRRRRFRRCGGHGEEAAAVVEGDAAAEAADGERGNGVGSHEGAAWLRRRGVELWMGSGRWRWRGKEANGGGVGGVQVAPHLQSVEQFQAHKHGPRTSQNTKMGRLEVLI